MVLLADLMQITLRVNGLNHTLLVEPRDSLLDVLREQLGLTGAKKGCDMGSCGACTVLVDGKSRLSCLTLAVSVEGMDILTVEGLGVGRLDPVQEAFVRNDALQCGFCTPGQIMSAKFLLSVKPKPSVEEVKHFMSGNICRCGAYPKIIKAVLDAANG
ncbi:MAG: (2Fe-2S)-binding protein [Thermoprotei archaeon]